MNLQRCPTSHYVTSALKFPLEQNGGHPPDKGSLFPSSLFTESVNLKQPKTVLGPDLMLEALAPPLINQRRLLRHSPPSLPLPVLWL